MGGGAARGRALCVGGSSNGVCVHAYSVCVCACARVKLYVSACLCVFMSIHLCAHVCVWWIYIQYTPTYLNPPNHTHPLIHKHTHAPRPPSSLPTHTCGVRGLPEVDCGEGGEGG